MDYQGIARTSYARVKDEAAFQAWASGFGCETVEVVTRDEQVDGEPVRLYGLVMEEGVPTSRYDDDTDEDHEVDVLVELQAHLAPGWAWKVVETGHEGARWLLGAAWVVTPASIQGTNLNKWMDESLPTGYESTEPSY